MPHHLSELPAPPKRFLLGHLKDLSRDPLGFLASTARDYGDLVPLQLGLQYSSCLLSDPAGVEEVLKAPNLFVKSRVFRMLKGLLGEGLLTSEGESWFRQRRLVQPVFHQKRVQTYGEIMVQYTEQMLQAWQDGENRDVHVDMMRLTLNIVMKTIFNQDVTEGEASDVTAAMEESMSWFESKRRQGYIALEWLPLPENVRYRRAIAQMDQAIYTIIQQRRQGAEAPEDLLSLLMQVRDEEDGSQMSDQQLRDEVATLILAGHETTANTLAWTWMLLGQHPTVLEDLHQELDGVLQGRSPTIDDLPHLPYTAQVIKESMRLYPPVPTMGREATQDYILCDHLIPQGTTVLISQWVRHRDPRYFDDPATFRPERWANDLEKQLPRGVYTPFGDGPRICIGKGFATMEAALLLATIAQRFRLELDPSRAVVPKTSLTLRPEQGIWVTLEQRQVPVVAQ